MRAAVGRERGRGGGWGGAVLWVFVVGTISCSRSPKRTRWAAAVVVWTVEMDTLVDRLQICNGRVWQFPKLGTEFGSN